MHILLNKTSLISILMSVSTQVAAAAGDKLDPLSIMYALNDMLGGLLDIGGGFLNFGDSKD